MRVASGFSPALRNVPLLGCPSRPHRMNDRARAAKQWHTAHGPFPFAHPCSLAGRGFILFFLRFLGGGMTSVLPPLALIFSAADLEKRWALPTRRVVTSPVPRRRSPP